MYYVPNCAPVKVENNEYASELEWNTTQRNLSTTDTLTEY